MSAATPIVPAPVDRKRLGALRRRARPQLADVVELVGEGEAGFLVTVTIVSRKLRDLDEVERYIEEAVEYRHPQMVQAKAVPA